MREKKGESGVNHETTVIFKVKGMTCHSCERRIEETVKTFEGVLKCKANYGRSTLSITYLSESIDQDDIIKALKDIGYGLSVYDSNARTFDVKQLLAVSVAEQNGELPFSFVVGKVIHIGDGFLEMPYFHLDVSSNFLEQFVPHFQKHVFEPGSLHWAFLELREKQALKVRMEYT